MAQKHQTGIAIRLWPVADDKPPTGPSPRGVDRLYSWPSRKQQESLRNNPPWPYGDHIYSPSEVWPLAGTDWFPH